MPNDPYEKLAPVPAMELRSSFANGDALPKAQVAPSHGGDGRSPALEWDRVDGAEAYLVTCYDPDAPTMSGFWHWVVYNIPGEVTSLAEGVGTGDEADLPEWSKAGYNETLSREYRGAAPPAGHGPHRYFFTVSALDAPLEVPENLTGARINFMARDHVIARGSLVATFENTGA